MMKPRSTTRKNITDRAHRYRANSPQFRPLGPKVCHFCRSKRFIVPHHKDGNPSNTKRTNLVWACKSCNTRIGKAFAKKGKGRRTHQYNPGADNLAQYVQAAVDHVRGSHDAAGKVLHETPKGKRRAFAREIWARRRASGNPRRRNYWDERIKDGSRVAVISANEASGPFWTRIYVNNGETATTTVKKAKTVEGARKQAREMLAKYKQNPASATELYRKFHGRGPDRVNNILVPATDPYAEHPELAQLGKLLSLYVGEGVKMTGAAGTVPKSVPDSEAEPWVRLIRFDDKQPDVAAEPGGTQIYFVGGNQNLDPLLEELGADPRKELLDLGFCYRLEYTTAKRFDKFRPIDYFHLLGEETGVQPRLVYDRVHKLIQLVGGEYVVKPEGIVN